MGLVLIDETEAKGLTISGMVISSKAVTCTNPRNQQPAVMVLEEIIHDNIIYKVMRFFDPATCDEIEVKEKEVTKYPKLPTLQFVQYALQPTDKFEITRL